MVTHNPEYEKYATKVIKMEDGKIKTINVRKSINVDDHDVVSDIIPPESSEVPA
jgi:ABC-type lipoprotein export system ATPase subunit